MSGVVTSGLLAYALRGAISDENPIRGDVQEKMTKIGKKLKKNNVAVDIVSFGCEEENREKLEAFHAAVNSGDNSHLVSVPSGMILSDVLFSTPIFMEEGGAEETAAPRSNIVDGFDYGELGVDPSLDPELALALRMSVEEERARQAAQQNKETQQTPAVGDASTAGKGVDNDVEAMDEDTLLQEALALSMQGGQDSQPQQERQEATEGVTMEDIDDPDLALALQMSMAEAQTNAGAQKDADAQEEEKKNDDDNASDAP